MVGTQEGKERKGLGIPPYVSRLCHLSRLVGFSWDRMGRRSSSPWVDPRYLLTHSLTQILVLSQCPNTVLETGDKRRLPGPAQRNSHSRVRDGHVTNTALAFWAICLALRTFATYLLRGCGEGEGMKQSTREMGRSGRPCKGLCLQDQFC